MSAFSIRNPYFVIVGLSGRDSSSRLSIPMALKLGTGAEQYAPMAQAIIGGLSASVILTIFIVPAAYLLIYRRTERQKEANPFNA